MKNGETAYIDLVQQARLGNKESWDRLAEITRARLRMYIYRLTLDNDGTEDILQETMLEMFKFLDKLERPERLWGWLLRIASNNVKDHYNRRNRRNIVDLESVGRGPRERQEGLEELVSEEVKQVVSAAMHSLKPRHRMVLALRCYEDMPFSKISEVMDCGKFGARMLFSRAKKALAKQLSRRGLTRGSLVIALALFGKMTATTKAAAANISVTAATLKVGAAASLIAVATSKTTIVTMGAAAVITAGAAKSDMLGGFLAGPGKAGVDRSLSAPQRSAKEDGVEESWYFYPSGSGGAVMMRLCESNGRPGHSRFRVLQNQHGNYSYENGAIYMENFRSYNADLSVRRLPTDAKALSAFISETEGTIEGMESISAAGRGLLIICKRDKGLNDKIWRVDRHSNVLDEDYFQGDWPTGLTTIDRRDEMHERGWTYFRISGRIDGKTVSGTGRIPFVYAESERYSPWLKLKIGNDMTIVDTVSGAYVSRAGSPGTRSYKPGTFLKGLARPWMGLHTIDTIRRDAAEQRIPFETERIEENKVRVTLACRHLTLAYVIDLEADVVREIAFSEDEDDRGRGFLRFSYLQDITDVDKSFVSPRSIGVSRGQQQGMGLLWLVELLQSSSAE